MAKQADKSSIERYNDILPTKIRELMSNHPKDGSTTTHKALAEAVGIRQQTVSQYASGQTQPTADVVLRIARFFGVSVDYLLTGVSSYNKEYSEELGLSEAAIQNLKRAACLYGQADMDGLRTVHYLDELLSDTEFYEFLDALYYNVDSITAFDAMTDEMKARVQDMGFDLGCYFIWQLQMFVQEFIRKELVKLGISMETK